jgi:hypothetical protein
LGRCSNGAKFDQCLFDSLQDAVDGFVNVPVAESKHSVPVLAQPGVPSDVLIWINMGVSVDFNDQAVFVANEVQDIRALWVLATETRAEGVAA